MERLRAEFIGSLRAVALPDPVRVYLHALACAAGATNGRGRLVVAPVPGGAEAATGLSIDLFSRVRAVALATGWLCPDYAAGHRLLLVDVPRWSAGMMELGLHDDPDDPQCHGRPVERFCDVETYRTNLAALA
ncbi:hypothetical protein VM98_28430 [Streptomyces rubellomurinus subsp. indigoferus]|nr:hypothetical protein VM98_28430 [Streptomyces rubellomurinus subsp. indigoferus]